MSKNSSSKIVNTTGDTINRFTVLTIHECDIWFERRGLHNGWHYERQVRGELLPKNLANTRPRTDHIRHLKMNQTEVIFSCRIRWFPKNDHKSWGKSATCPDYSPSDLNSSWHPKYSCATKNCCRFNSVSHSVHAILRYAFNCERNKL